MVYPINPDRPRLIILLGPTGVGKSKLAIDLAEEFGGEIINADSMQVYRYMDIGTAKPTLEEQQRVKHHLIDVVTPDQPFNAALYRAIGRKVIDQLHREKKPIFVVGGTGLYIKVLTRGIFPSPSGDSQLRERLKREAEEQGKEFLYERLKRVDPITASRLHPHDLFRVIRALEIFESTGIPISFFHEQHRFGEHSYETLKIGLEIDRDKLYQRINERVDQMVEKGFIEEVKRLLEMGYGPKLKPMQSLGYRQMVQVLLDKLNLEEALRCIKRDTRHYAKRQWTWFKADREIWWRDLYHERDEIAPMVRSFLRERR
ncbi:MAG: tRNA (adenosine(37)-N6)-dimethylallyltransferase MiaA [Thermodesulfobacteriota bacterium]